MRPEKYYLYDDMRKIGIYQTLKEIYETGYIKQKLTYFYRVFSRDGVYLKDNICVIPIRNQFARCLFLAHTINRRAKLCPDVFKMDTVLSNAVKEITGNEL